MTEADVGRMIKDLRKRAGLLQKELAERSGVSPSAISVAESGGTCPRASKVFNIIAACGYEVRIVKRKEGGE